MKCGETHPSQQARFLHQDVLQSPCMLYHSSREKVGMEEEEELDSVLVFLFLKFNLGSALSFCVASPMAEVDFFCLRGQSLKKCHFW